MTLAQDRRKRKWLAGSTVSLCLCVLAACDACATLGKYVSPAPETPREVIVTLDAAIMVAAQTSAQLNATGQIDGPTVVRIHQILSGAAGAVDQARAELIASGGDEVTVEACIAQAEAALQMAQVLIARGQVTEVQP